MASPVAKATVRKDIYNALYSLITASITDLQSPVRSISGWCFSAWPQKTRFDTDDFPIVVFEKPEINTETFTMTKTKVFWMMNIIVYTAGDNSAKNNNTLTDQIYSIFEGASISTLRDDYYLHITNIETEVADVVQFEGIKTHISTLTFGGFFIHS